MQPDREIDVQPNEEILWEVDYSTPIPSQSPTPVCSQSALSAPSALQRPTRNVSSAKLARSTESFALASRSTLRYPSELGNQNEPRKMTRLYSKALLRS